MRVDDRAGLDAATLAALCARIPAHHTLGDLVQWGARHSPRFEVVDVVVQDEFTHDVVLAWIDGLYLVYDST